MEEQTTSKEKKQKILDKPVGSYIMGIFFIILSVWGFFGVFSNDPNNDIFAASIVFSLVSLALSFLSFNWRKISKYSKKLEAKNTEEARLLLEKEQEEKIIKKEKSRNQLEKYKISEIGGWVFWLLIPFVIGGVYIAIDFFSNDYINWYILFFFGLTVASMSILFDLDEKWRKGLQCKAKISDEEDYRFHPDRYLYGYFYTDSPLEFYAYKLSKIITYLITIVMFVAIVILLFIWLGSISIAPTTIIIILLIILIVQNSHKHDSK